jgi:hypothetical protein
LKVILTGIILTTKKELQEKITETLVKEKWSRRVMQAALDKAAKSS